MLALPCEGVAGCSICGRSGQGWARVGEGSRHLSSRRLSRRKELSPGDLAVSQCTAGSGREAPLLCVQFRLFGSYLRIPM
jgi:hypothetical protein